jgi:hypothetical protein
MEADVVIDIPLVMPPPTTLMDEFMEAMLRLTVMADFGAIPVLLVVVVVVVGEVGADTMPCRIVTASSPFCPIF